MHSNTVLAKHCLLPLNNFSMHSEFKPDNTWNIIVHTALQTFWQYIVNLPTIKPMEIRATRKHMRCSKETLDSQFLCTDIHLSFATKVWQKYSQILYSVSSHHRTLIIARCDDENELNHRAMPSQYGSTTFIPVVHAI